MKPKQNLIGLSLVELEKFFISIDEKKFRAHQVFNWIHSKGVIDFSKMTNLSKNLVHKLEENSYIKTPKVVNTIKSNDGTVKYLLKLDEEAFIEMVTIPEKKKNYFMRIITGRLCSSVLFLYKRISRVQKKSGF